MAKTKNPRVSVNKLAEYLEANATRRKQIVSDTKYPEKFITTRYKDARENIKSYLTNGLDEDFILDAIDDFKAIKPKTDFQAQDKQLSIESLEALLEADLSILDACDLSIHDDENKLIKIMGVDISVNPDIIITKNIGGIVHKGALKIHLSKNNTLSEESQLIVSVMVYKYVSDFIIKLGESANTKICYSLDVFNVSIKCCPSSYKLRMKRIEAACEEIAMWWGKL